MDIPNLSYLQQKRDPELSQTLRPDSFEEFIGQERAVKILDLMLDEEGWISDPILLSGPPGLGKTTLSKIISGERKTWTYIGGLITHKGEIARMVAEIEEGDTVFIDEIHAVPKKFLELLYPVLEDGQYYFQGRASDLPRFNFIAATTDPGKLPEPFRDRMGQTVHLDYYPRDEMQKIVERAMVVFELERSQEEIEDIARRTRGVPRIAGRLIKRLKDLERKGGEQSLTDLWAILDVDENGLEYQDRLVLDFLKRHGVSGVDTIAHGTGIDPVTIQRSIEPFLIRFGWIRITPRGRELVDR